MSSRFFFLLLSPVVLAFTPNLHGRVEQYGLFLAATVEEAPPVKEAPSAGWVPEWENRPSGLTETEFLRSDESSPDLSGMWECPLTRWDSEK